MLHISQMCNTLRRYTTLVDTIPRPEGVSLRQWRREIQGIITRYGRR